MLLSGLVINKEGRFPNGPFRSNGASETAAYRCSRVIHQSAGKESRPSSSSSPRRIVNNSAAPATALRRSRGKLPNGHAAPGHELSPLSSNDSKEAFGPGASSRSIDEHSDDNPTEVFCKHFARIERRTTGENSAKAKSNSTQKEQVSHE